MKIGKGVDEWDGVLHGRLWEQRSFTPWRSSREVRRGFRKEFHRFPPKLLGGCVYQTPREGCGCFGGSFRGSWGSFWEILGQTREVWPQMVDCLNIIGIPGRGKGAAKLGSTLPWTLSPPSVPGCSWKWQLQPRRVFLSLCRNLLLWRIFWNFSEVAQEVLPALNMALLCLTWSETLPENVDRSGHAHHSKDSAATVLNRRKALDLQALSPTILSCSKQQQLPEMKRDGDMKEGESKRERERDR